MDQVDCIVVGAGVIGLALARALALAGREVLILEANERFGAETSSRNNEVIHAGFLYPTGSMKARLCRNGRDALYRYCQDRGVTHRRIGKLMIATSNAEADILRGIAAAASKHGVDDLVWHDAADARAIEPNLRCVAALESPSTGIVDAHGVMSALIGDAEAAGATVAYRTRVTAGYHDGAHAVIQTESAGGVRHTIGCRSLINAAGLGARDIAVHFRGSLPTLPQIVLSKGSFFSYSGALPFDTLVVPIGETLSGGGAFTIDTGGQGKFGPDRELIDRIDYAVDPARLRNFAECIRRFYPAVDVSRLSPNYSGIRPCAAGFEGAQTDWIMLTPTVHGLRGVYHLLGFDSPGLTSCLAVAAHLVDCITSETDGSS
jgi:L-2-hydroxyglutarate oxidase LhgO